MRKIKFSLVYKLIFVFVIAAILPFTLSAILFYIQEMSIVEKRETLNDEKTVLIVNDKIDKAISSCLINIKSLADSYSFVVIDFDQQVLLTEIKRVAKYNKYIDDITVLDTKGKVITSINYDYSGSWTSKSWYLDAVRGNTVFSPAYLQVIIPECTISLNVPVMANDGVKGVISANINLGLLWDDILVSEENESSYFVIADKDGRVIRHPSSTFLLEKFPDKEIHNLFINEYKGIGRYRTSNKGINKGYVQKISSTYPETDFGWRLAYLKTKSDASLLQTTVYNHIKMIGLLVTVFIITVAIVFARRITRPIIAITSAADRIAEGDYNISLDSYSSDEIGELSKSINQMAGKLQVATTTRNELAGEVMYYENIEKQLKKARKKAEMANKAKDDFLACVSHEVRTPLNAIIGYTESLIIDNEVPDYTNKLRTILSESEHLLCLLNDILDNAKIQSGKLDIDLRPCDLIKTIEDIRRLVEPKALNKGLTFDIDYDDVPTYVITDQLRLRQVILNLLSNAIKFTNIGSVKLILNVVKKEQSRVCVRFSVIDTGIGISKEKQDSIFESYIQADNSIARTYGGTGLGTTISKSIVGLMGGGIGLESEVGVGSNFWFELDMAICNEQEIEILLKENVCTEKVYTQCDFSHVKVLLAEDYQTNRNLIINQLKRLNVNCDIAENGRQAVDMAADTNYDLILMDLQMPVMDGISATKAIRSLDTDSKNAVIVAMTASVEQSIKNDCLNAGMNDIVCKPLRIASFAYLFEKWQGVSSGDCPGINNLNSDHYIDCDSDFAGLLDWDKNLALELFGNNQMLLEMSVKNYITDVEGLITVIDNAISDKNFEQIRVQAHKIKGGAACVAATSISDVAGKLETRAKEGVDEDMSLLLKDLTDKFEKFKSQAI